MSATPEFDDVLQRLARADQRAAQRAGRQVLHQASCSTPASSAARRKLGEESTETVIAALGSDTAALKREAADLLYHLLVLLESRHVPLDDVLAELRARMGTSGLAEKAARGSGTSS